MVLIYPAVNFGEETSFKLTDVFREFHNKDYLLKVISTPNIHPPCYCLTIKCLYIRLSHIK